MSSRTTIVPFPGDKSRGVSIYICANDELLTCGRDLEVWGKEASREACLVASYVINRAGMDCENDSTFQNWEGGIRTHDDVKCGYVHARLWVRENLAGDDDADAGWSAWESGADEWSASQRKAVEEILDRADNFMHTELEEWEKREESEREEKEEEEEEEGDDE